MRRLQISVGAVRALSYLHNDVGHNFSVIHHNINCNSILLDENWEAKVSGFEYSMTIPAGNLDLAYEKLGIGTHKSDMFSIGIVLFELMCGKDAFISKDDSSIASLAIFHYENRRLHELVDPDLYDQMNQQSFGIVSETAYSCLIGEGISSNMIQVLKLLQKALEIQQAHENNEHPVVAAERRLSDHMKLKLKSLEHMRIQFEDIVKATENFATKYCIVSGGFGSVYIAELVHVDKAYIFAPDKENEREVPKKRSTVAIKRINNIEDEMSQQGFQAEIEMLTSCKHSNIITLLGFCDEGRALILIYEYASNGSLNYYLQKTRDNENDSWAQRVKICLYIAKGLRYLHTTEGDRDVIVHRDIKSANILLDENFKAKIGDFGLSIFPSVSEQRPTRFSSITLGTPGYMDPQYKKDAKLKKESDVYSFGVVMFEMLCGTVAYDRKYAKNNAGLALIARQHFNNGKIKEMLDPKIKEQITESLFTSIKGPSQESLYTFSKIAFECLAKEQVERPTMEVVVKELEKALFFQPSRVQKLQLQEILYATNHFSDENLLKEGGLGNLYKGRLFQSGKLLDIVARRLNGNYGQGDVEFRTEISMLSSLKHINIISFVGFVDENDEKIVIYELATHGSLDQHISDPTLNWSRRLQICLGVARALSYVHYAIIHCDINSSKIFLDEDWEPKLFGFEFSTKYPQSWRHRLLYSHDSRYSHESMTPKFDVYCFGTLMFEILCGRKPVIREDVVEEKVDDIIDPNLRKQIDTQSLISFLNIAETCLKKELVERPTMDQIVKELEEAMELQSKHENLSVLEGHSAAAAADEDASTKRSKVDDDEMKTDSKDA
ncbi:putative protein kinase RLK-Pelle-LRR-I-1 family [Helianthus annuus]|nr:putative protein kinase RLK-Pelle-LRR-I-1 family [Helianthus annuus]